MVKDADLADLISLPVEEFNKRISVEKVDESGKVVDRVNRNKFELLNTPPKQTGITASEADALLTRKPVNNPIKDTKMNQVDYVPESGTAPVTVTTEVIDATAVDDSRLTYLQARSRVTFELENCYYTLPVIDVLDNNNGVIILLPAGKGDVSFIPKPGTEVSLQFGGNNWNCFCPGTIFYIEKLGIAIITLIKKE